MRCEICKTNEATVHFSQVTGDKVSKIDLCESCAKAKGLTDPNNITMLGDLLGDFAAGPPAEAESQRCPECGFTQANFKKQGRLGCAVCYETFETGLRPLLKAMHKGERHVGKSPRKARARVSPERLRELEKELALAIKEERFEHAAQLRDEIRALESKARLSAR
ncbi:MAG: UvrB/UvrC motif-containing protein [Verrucomicrobiae bacterium]|nr:UvrB/UvrC motif-containing protein [Verrucomicrobiae bacterium]